MGNQQSHYNDHAQNNDLMHNTITCCVGRHKQRPSIENINIEKLLSAEINNGKKLKFGQFIDK